MSGRSRDDIPDWLKPLYEKARQQRPQQAPSTPQQPVVAPGLPDWLRGTYERGTGAPAAPAPRPDTSPLKRRIPTLPNVLDVMAYELQDEPSAELQEHLSSHNIAVNHAFMTAINKIIEEAEKQVIGFMKMSPGTLPTTVTIYDIAEVAKSVRYHPVQLATVLADVILLATNEYGQAPKDQRRRAILGIAELIINRQKSERTPEGAAKYVVDGILQMVENLGSMPADRWHVVYLHSRVLVLQEMSRALEAYVE
jgi:hypothetical protein